MSYIASHFATVPSKGFEWYLIFLECAFTDEVKKEVDQHFLTLGSEVGPKVLVVRGFHSTAFRDSVFEAPAFYDVNWRKWASSPSLVVTNRDPSKALNDTHILESGKVMIFPLSEIQERSKTLTGFLSELVEALRKEDSMAALESLDGSRLQKSWGWLSRYMKMEPGFFGFNVKLNDAVRDLLAR